MVSNDDLLEELKRLYRELGKTPSHKDMENQGKYSGGIYTYRFDSWNSALEKAGLENNEQKNYDKTCMVNEIKRVSEEFFGGEPFTRREMDEYGEISTDVYIRQFGGWNNALEEAELDEIQRRMYDEGEILEEIERISSEECAGERPTVSEWRKHSTIGYYPIKRLFGNWNNAIDCAGFEPFTMPTGEDSWNWSGGCKDYYGPSWYIQRKEVLDRDGYKCKICNIDNNIDVHHIKPARKWNLEEHEEMNNLSNLVSLCRKCHQKFEGKWQDSTPEEFVKKAKKEIDY